MVKCGGDYINAQNDDVDDTSVAAYFIPNLNINGKVVKTDKRFMTAMRSPGKQDGFEDMEKNLICGMPVLQFP